MFGSCFRTLAVTLFSEFLYLFFPSICQKQGWMGHFAHEHTTDTYSKTSHLHKAVGDKLLIFQLHFGVPYKSPVNRNHLSNLQKSGALTNHSLHQYWTHTSKSWQQCYQLATIKSHAKSIKPLCGTECINISVHVRNPKRWQPYYCLDTWKYWTY